MGVLVCLGGGGDKKVTGACVACMITPDLRGIAWCVNLMENNGALKPQTVRFPAMRRQRENGLREGENCKQAFLFAR